MSLLYRVVNWILAINEIFMCYCFVGLLDDREFIRKNKVYVSIWSMGIGWALAFNRRTSPLVSWLMLVLQVMFIFISLTIKNSENKLLKFSIVTIFNVCITFIQLLFAFGILTFFVSLDVESIYLKHSIYRIICYAFTIVTMGMINIVIMYYRKKSNASIAPFQWTFFSYGMAGLLLVIAFQHQLLVYGRIKSLESLFFLLIFVGAFILTLVGAIKNVETRTELELVEVKEKMLEENYKEIQMMYRNYAYTYHDMKNHLIILENYCKANETKKALDYIAKIRKPVSQIKRYINSGNEILDIISNFKLAEAEKEGIKIEVVIDRLDFKSMDEMDICAIFSNLLDNAIEACKHVRKEKWIRIFVKNLGDMLIINILNSCNDEGLKKHNNGDFKTIKRGMHGYGINSVKTKVAKYGGNAEWSFENNIFTVMITFYNTMANKVHSLEHGYESKDIIEYNLEENYEYEGN